jgi:hypothetical protein
VSIVCSRVTIAAPAYRRMGRNAKRPAPMQRSEARHVLEVAAYETEIFWATFLSFPWPSVTIAVSDFVPAVA